MKPIALITGCLPNSTRKGDLVLDPFGGSGSTLLAAHGTCALPPDRASTRGTSTSSAAATRSRPAPSPSWSSTGQPHSFVEA